MSQKKQTKKPLKPILEVTPLPYTEGHWEDSIFNSDIPTPTTQKTQKEGWFSAQIQKIKRRLKY